MNIFWSGQHWICAAALYLPVQKGGQGLKDIRSSSMAFWLQAAQRLLYHTDASWLKTAFVLLRWVGNPPLHWILSQKLQILPKLNIT